MELSHHVHAARRRPLGSLHLSVLVSADPSGSRRETLIASRWLSLEQVEHYLIERALATQGGNVSEAARVLGLSRSALYRRLASLGIRS